MERKIKVKSIIEIVGSPKEYAEEAMNMVVKKLAERSELKIINKKLFPAEQIKDKPFFSTFLDMEFEVGSIDHLLGYCLDFMPGSVEIIDPEDLRTNNLEISNVMNDMLARLHEFNIAIKNLQASNILQQRELDKIKKSKEDKK